ncbi:hypothetical protein BDW67DRAFT_21171 [Aspergillus spinulosporus]
MSKTGTLASTLGQGLFGACPQLGPRVQDAWLKSADKSVVALASEQFLGVLLFFHGTMVVANFAFVGPRLLAWVDGAMPRTGCGHRWFSPRAFRHSRLFPLSAHTYRHGRLSDLQPEKSRVTYSTVSAATHRHSGSYPLPYIMMASNVRYQPGALRKTHVGMVRIWIHVEFFFPSFFLEPSLPSEMSRILAERWSKTLCQAGFLRYKEG